MLHGFWQNERGFTLIELMIPIIIMMILVSVAVPIWLGAVESRKVDSATNRMVADLRRAHTNATNRLQNWKVDLRPAGGTAADYRMGPCVNPCTAPLPPPSLSLEGGTRFRNLMTGGRVVFKSDGGSTSNLAGNIVWVTAADGRPCSRIEINPVTSRVEVLPTPEELCQL
jgi:prepilin-type N-terminal cleavage/methylation domain-containing protein